MRIYLKMESGRRWFIPAPLWLIKAGLGMGGWGIRIAGKHMTADQVQVIDNIDFKELRKALDVLKAYKGLPMVDIKAKDGTEVRIII